MTDRGADGAAARARALVGIAAPEHREALERECSALLQRTTSE